MNIYTFDGEDFKIMLIGSVNYLGKLKSEIDFLNVFPVPDGDTGSNMYLTLLAGVKKAQQIESNNIGEVAGAAARGCLYGARGNSGVILSQVVQGFASALDGKEKAGAKDVARAFSCAHAEAERAVTNPREGTILTLCREIARSYEESVIKHSDLVRVTIQVYKHAQVVLEKTMEQLPELKEAGVVDAGGKGLVTILYGIIEALRDRAAERDIQLFDLAAIQQKEFVANRMQGYKDHIEHTYCTEFVIIGTRVPREVLKEELSPYGDCLLVVGDDEAVKVHIHSNHPGLVLECGLKYGYLQHVQVNNMEEQGQEFKKEISPKDNKAVGVAAAAVGDGISAVLESMGVDRIVTGGQSMNPSAEDLVSAVNDLSAEKVILLPNNKNVIMAAEQAAAMTEKEVAVIPTGSIPQGIAALLGYNPLQGLEENEQKMKEYYEDVVSGEVTRAVKDSAAGGMQLEEGQLIGLINGEITTCGQNLAPVTADLIETAADPDGGMVTLFFGNELDEEEAGAVLEYLEERFSGIDFELYYGGQPLYYFIISIE